MAMRSQTAPRWITIGLALSLVLSGVGFCLCADHEHGGDCHDHGPIAAHEDGDHDLGHDSGPSSGTDHNLGSTGDDRGPGLGPVHLGCVCVGAPLVYTPEGARKNATSNDRNFELSAVGEEDRFLREAPPTQRELHLRGPPAPGQRPLPFLLNCAFLL